MAVTTVADDATKRAHIATTLLEIAERNDVAVAPGIGWSEPPAGRRSWFGHEGRGLIDDEPTPSYERDAIDLLLETTLQRDVDVATVGMQSNIAGAIDRDADFPRRVPRLHVMGGVFAPIVVGDIEHPASADHNLMVDPDASVRALNAGIPTRYTPLNVTVRAPLRRLHLDKLRNGDALCRSLAEQIDVWSAFADHPDDIVAMLHDPLTVACAVDRRFVSVEERAVSVAIRDGIVRTFFDDVDGTPAEVVTSVEGAAFADFWLETVLG